MTRRRVIIVAIASLLILCATPLSTLLWLISLHPAPDHNYAVDLAAAHQQLRPPGAPDALPLIEAAHLAITSNADERQINALLDQLADARWASEEGYNVPTLSETRNLAPITTLGQACIERLHAAWTAGDAEGVARHLRAALALIDVWWTRPGGPPAGSYLESWLGDALLTALLSHPTTPEVIDAALTVLTSHPQRPPVGAAFILEHLAALDFIQHTYTKDPERGVFLPAWSGWDGFLTETPPIPERLANYEGFDCPRRGDLTRAVNTLFEGLRALDSWRDSPAASTLMTTYASELNRLAPRHPEVLSFGSSALQPGPWLRLARDDDRDRSGLILALRLEQHRITTGNYPQTLAPLDHHLVTDLDREWLYRPIDPATDPHARAYLLYLPGADGVDNGGLSDHTSSSPRNIAEGQDWIFNRLPPER